MVIQKFNKLIRNKWLWGAFAVAISAFFAFDFLIADLGAERPSEASETTEETVAADDAEAASDEGAKGESSEEATDDASASDEE